MKVNITGTTRIVFVFKNIVIKIPNYHYSWEHFLKGIIANINECKLWRYNSGKFEDGKSYLLCPVKWTSWGGFILVMERADMGKWYKEVIAMPIIPDDSNLQKERHEMIYKKWIDAGFGGDDKCDNYGYLNDRLVKVDYGAYPITSLKNTNNEDSRRNTKNRME